MGGEGREGARDGGREKLASCKQTPSWTHLNRFATRPQGKAEERRAVRRSEHKARAGVPARLAGLLPQRSPAGNAGNSNKAP